LTWPGSLSGKIELKKERVELGSLLRNAIQSARHHFQAGEQELEISLPETPIYLQADAIRLEQAFGNLLHNASRYTGAGGHIGKISRVTSCLRKRAGKKSTLITRPVKKSRSNARKNKKLRQI
jgi:nitrogen fixation/metabolism regulation signal transduction histidine kinase